MPNEVDRTLRVPIQDRLPKDTVDALFRYRMRLRNAKRQGRGAQDRQRKPFRASGSIQPQETVIKGVESPILEGNEDD